MKEIELRNVKGTTDYSPRETQISGGKKDVGNEK